MKCKYCDTINEDDAVFCKKCGHSLLYEEEVKTKEKDKNKKPKTKTKVKKKVKKVTKTKNNKSKNKSDRKMSFGQKLLLIIMTLIIIILLGACSLGAYYYYQEQNIVVPDVVGLTYTDAEVELARADLGVIKIEKEVDDIEEDGIVIKQNKKNSSKVAKNSKIKLTVGVLKKYKIPDFIGKSLDEAKNELSENDISYTIEYKESDEEDDIIIEQTPAKGTRIDRDKIITLVVSKKKKDVPNENIDEDIEEKNDIDEEE